MRFSHLALHNFRNYPKFKLNFDREITVIVGDNGSGKTALIEAIYLLSHGFSFRAGKIEEMVSLGQELGRVEGRIFLGEAGGVDLAGGQSQDQTEKIDLEVMLTRGEVQGQKSAKRLFAVNQVRRPASRAVNLFHAVVFRPEDMRLVEGSPGRRRSFLDDCLVNLFPDYAASLKTYDQTLLRRNRLLLQVRDGLQPRSALTFYTLSLIKHGQVLQKARTQFFAFTRQVDFPHNFVARYQPSLISQERLDHYADREIAAGHTLVGPHKDDYWIQMPPELWPEFAAGLSQENEGLNLALYGSRGQQRFGVLWLKMCELAYTEQITGSKVLLLLDDVLSELDSDARGLVINLMKQRQTILTTASHGLADRVSKLGKKVQKTSLPTNVIPS